MRQEYQAWRFGPVIPDLYHSVRQHGANTVPYAIPGFDCPEYDAGTEQLVSHICDRWGRWPGARLAFLSAGYGSPWWRTYYRPGQNDRPTIPNALIEQYYRRALEKTNAAPQSG